MGGDIVTAIGGESVINMDEDELLELIGKQKNRSHHYNESNLRIPDPIDMIVGKRRQASKGSDCDGCSGTGLNKRGRAALDLNRSGLEMLREKMQGMAMPKKQGRTFVNEQHVELTYWEIIQGVFAGLFDSDSEEMTNAEGPEFDSKNSVVS